MNVGFRIPTEVNTGPTERSFDLRVYLNFLWRHWKFIGAAVALALLVALINLARATPLYTATTKVLLEDADKSPTDTRATDLNFSDRAFIENQLAILEFDALLRRVVVKERLAGSKAQSPELLSKEDQSKEDEAILDAINGLRGALAVSRSGQGAVLNISITWEDPARAAQLANAVADSYVVNQLDARFESAKRASAWLSDRLVDLRQQLRDSEEAVVKFRNAHGLTRGGPTVALNDQQLADLNNKLIAARTNAAEKKTLVDFIADVNAGKKSMDSLPDSLLATSNIITSLRAKLVDVSQRKAELLGRYNSGHPALVNVEVEKRDIERSIAAETQRMAQTVRSEYALAKARLDTAEQAMREATGQGGLDSEETVQLRELERAAAVNKSLFEDFLQKAKISDEQATFRAREARVLVPAQKPGGPSFPRKSKVLYMALLAGIGLGVGGAVALEMLKAGFTTPREVEDLLGIPVLASVHQLKKAQLVKNGKSFAVPFYQMHHPLSPFSEAMRTLRSSIHMSDVDQPPKVIHVTSARPGEGKSTIATSLAISAAAAGLKVVLVDADLRRTSTSRFFKLEQEKGLVDLLIGATTFDDVLTFYKDVKLTVIPAGTKSLTPSDVLGSERMKELISRLKETFDYVVLDTPPIGPVIDAVIMANLADKTIFVVQWASTPRELVETSIQQVSTHKRVAGVVFNRINQGRAKKYGGGYNYAKAYQKYYE